jgi:hypothetical protein
VTGQTVRIIVPSRKRSLNMTTIEALLPSATVVVDEAEMPEYLTTPVAGRLVPHGGTKKGIASHPAVVNWCQQAFDEDILVFLDDDFKRVFAWSGTAGRRIWGRTTDSGEIEQIIYNACQVCEDIDRTLFGWARTMNVVYLRLWEIPIVPSTMIGSAFGIRGASRRRKMNTNLLGRSAVDYTLQALLHDRAVYCDRRFYFDFGPIFGGAGGNSGVVSPEAFRRSTEALKEIWGAHVSATTIQAMPPKGLSKDGTPIYTAATAESGISLNVQRKNPRVR